MTSKSCTRKTLAVLFSGALAVGTITALTAPATASGSPPTRAPAAGQAVGQSAKPSSDDLPDPLSDKQAALREEAISDVLSGKRKAQKIDGEQVVKMGKEPATPAQPNPQTFNNPQSGDDGQAAPQSGSSAAKGRQDQYVQLSREKSDNLFVILVDFGNKRHENYPDEDSDPATPGPEKFNGPQHGNFPAPDRSVDNTTVYDPPFNKKHYKNLYFSDKDGANSLKNYYQKQSSGRYSVDGEVAGWVRVPYNEARYGRNVSFDADGNVVCEDIVCPNVWKMIEDGIDSWVAKKHDEGMSTEQIKAELSKFDQWDRNDYDGDGDFNEPDGYLDHFQILHAGGGEAAGSPAGYGEDAIWSHSWYVNATDIGVAGPENNPAGGYQIGDTGIWVGNYLTEPENAGIGVLAHEYGHDLGLPDEYDTTYTGESSAAFWTLMSSGSYMSLPQDGGIGTRANDLNAWDKLQLGWLDYQIATPGKKRTYKLGPAEYNSRKAQGMVVVLPDKQVTSNYGDPYAGENMWWSTKGNDMTTSMTHEFDLTGKSSATMTLKSKFDIEANYDFLYAEASTDGGDTWTALDGTVNGQPFPRDGADRPALTGSVDDWADVSIPLDQVAGQDVKFRFRYRTDAAVAQNGFFADQIAVDADGEQVFADGAENGTDGWDTDGFTITSGHETKAFDNFYVVGNKNYVSYDKTLKSGPYNAGFPAKPNFVEHFPYQDGLLVSYWDTSYTDNNVGQHPGHGQILPIDAHPRPIFNIEGQPWRTRIQVYDATFGTQRVDSFDLHVNGKPSHVRGGKAQPKFDDHKKYWYANKPDAGVKVPDTGTKIKVLRENGTSVKLRVKAPGIG